MKLFVLRATPKHPGHLSSCLSCGARGKRMGRRFREPIREVRAVNVSLSNCTWANGEPAPEFRQSFDMIADMATTCASEKAAGASLDDLCQARFPESNGFQTLAKS